MASVSKQQVLVLTLTELEAAAVRGVLSLVGGPTDKLGRRETNAVNDALAEAGVGTLDCWDGKIQSMSK